MENNQVCYVSLIGFVIFASREIIFILDVLFHFEERASNFIKLRPNFEFKCESLMRRAFLMLAGSMIFHLITELMITMLLIGLLKLLLGLIAYFLYRRMEKRFKLMLRGQ